MSAIGIVGGGPAGSICARELVRHGHRVILFERRVARLARPAETCMPRVRSAIEAACGTMLPSRLFRPFDHFCTGWGSDELERHACGPRDAGPAVVLDRPAFDDWLLALAEADGVMAWRGWQVVDARLSDRTWRLGVRRGQESRSIEVDFVVEATGPSVRSPFLPDASRSFFDRLVCTSMDVPDAGLDVPAGVESCRSGWWYTARTVAGLRTISWFTDADTAGLATDRRKSFADSLEQTTHMRRLAGSLPKRGVLHAISARTSLRDIVASPFWISVGDAARTIDPLSGGGIGRAVDDAVDAATAVSRAIRDRDPEPLRGYASARIQGFHEQLAAQQSYYAAESRLAGREFWRRRVSAESIDDDDLADSDEPVDLITPLRSGWALPSSRPRQTLH
jgi:flavin-dependent dehydrogenase